MDWREEYKRRLTSAEDAVGIVEKDDLVVIPIARLMGKNHRQRAQELIAVAHPDFRAGLRREAERLLG